MRVCSSIGWFIPYFWANNYQRRFNRLTRCTLASLQNGLSVCRSVNPMVCPSPFWVFRVSFPQHEDASLALWALLSRLPNSGWREEVEVIGQYIRHKSLLGDQNPKPLPTDGRTDRQTSTLIESLCRDWNGQFSFFLLLVRAWPSLSFTTSTSRFFCHDRIGFMRS